MDNNVPRIENIKYQPETEPYLAGIRITDPQPFGEVLEQLGVDPDDVPNWTIYSDYPGEEQASNPKAVVLSPYVVGHRMNVVARDEGNAMNRRHKYAADFKPEAAKVAIHNLVLKVAENEPDWSHINRIHSIARNVGYIAGLAASEVGIIYGLDIKNFWAFTGAGITGGIVVSRVVSHLSSPFRKVKQRVRTFIQDNPRALQSIEDSVLPVYDTDGNS